MIITTAKTVTEIPVTETQEIVNILIDVKNQSCTVTREIKMDWMSGTDACSSTTTKDNTISGEDFANIFSPIYDSLETSLINFVKG